MKTCLTCNADLSAYPEPDPYCAYCQKYEWDVVSIGDRIMLVEMPNDPCPIDPGSVGTVAAIKMVYSVKQIEVDWDYPRSLSLVPGDRFRILAKQYVVNEEPWL